MVKRFNLDQSRRAVFSECERYRYELQITWDEALPVLGNIGLNPSTADEFKNDPTVHRDIERAAALGYGSLLKLNLFAFRSTDPRGMKQAEDPYGEWRDPACLFFAAAAQRKVELLIAAWGNHGTHQNRANDVREVARTMGWNLYKYELNKSKEPCHPLYKPYSLKPTIYEF
jgi:hypothetical protein